MTFRKKMFHWFFSVAFFMALMIPAMPGQASAAMDIATKRLAGDSRTLTAVAIAKEGWPNGSQAVVLARGDNFPDALAGVTLAAAYDAPILLTDNKILSSEASQEISRLQPQTIYILGGTGAISQAIEDELSATYIVKRLNGASRYETAASIAAYLKEAGKITTNEAVIAFAHNFPDALAISSWAAHNAVPILLTEKNTIPDATSTALKSLQISKTIIVGGTGVISSDVAALLPDPTRYGGNNRYETARDIINGLHEQTDNLFLATGQNFPDALAGSALAAKYGMPILLVGSTLDPSVSSVLADNYEKTTKVFIIGGFGAVSTQNLGNVIRQLGGYYGSLKVSFIDVGQGDAILIQTPGGQNVLIDGGTTADASTVENYLHSLGVTKLDEIIATHPDADHIGGLDTMIADFTVGKVYMPNVTNDTEAYADLLRAVQAKNLTISPAKTGGSLQLDGEVTGTFVAPVMDDYPETNNDSAVIHLTYNAMSFLFTGDAEIPAENDMIASGADLKSTVLKVGHHGSSSSTSDAFLNAVKPKYAVISAGENSYGHPADATLNRLSQHGIATYRTDKSGTIVVQSDGTYVTFNASPSAYPASTSQTGSLVVSASVSNPSPSQYSTESVRVNAAVNGQPVQGAQVKITAHYKSTDSTYTGTTGTSGTASIPFSIGRASIGYTVKVDVVVTYHGVTKTTSTAFTPK